jgi:hypothetical protein
MHIIIKNKRKHEIFGMTRSEQEENMRKEWGPTITDEQLDKLKFMEKKHREKTGSKKNFFGAENIDDMKD